MFKAAWVVFVVVLGLAIWFYKRRTSRSDFISRHVVDKKVWYDAFPQASKERIDTFIASLQEGMALPSSIATRVLPSDKVVDVYKAVYGGKEPLVDAPEIETFLELLATRFDVPVEILDAHFHNDTTFEELFENVMKAG